MPPAPAGMIAEPLHTQHVRHLPGAVYTQYRLVHPDHPGFHFRLEVLVPRGDGPFPVVLSGDGCWLYSTMEVMANIVRRGFIFARFSRTELAPDTGETARSTAIYKIYPDLEFGALSAWAWGYHRCVDFLLTLKSVDPARIAIVGHSRGGKTTLLAGATDERIALTCANCSGFAGAGSYFRQGEGCERIPDSRKMFSYWYGPRLWEFEGREQEMPFDQHYLKALIAPRAYLSIEALGDIWANPTGTWQTHTAAREVYRFLDAKDRIAIRYREGEHDHSLADWTVFLEFMEWQFTGKTPGVEFNVNPFPELPPAFTWSAGVGSPT